MPSPLRRMKKYSGPTLQMYKDIAGEEEAEDSLTSESSYLYQKWTPPSFDDHGWIAITPSQVSFSRKIIFFISISFCI